MKCSHPMCNREIGLVWHRRGFGKGLYCSRRCRDSYPTALPQRKPRLVDDARLFASLFAPVNARAHQRLAPATVRAQRPKISF
jgi:hypothetical protein